MGYGAFWDSKGIIGGSRLLDVVRPFASQIVAVHGKYDVAATYELLGRTDDLAHNRRFIIEVDPDPRVCDRLAGTLVHAICSSRQCTDNGNGGEDGPGDGVQNRPIASKRRQPLRKLQPPPLRHHFAIYNGSGHRPPPPAGQLSGIRGGAKNWQSAATIPISHAVPR